MIAKLSRENHVELPRQLIEAVGNPSHFDVSLEGGKLVLTPARDVTADDVYAKLASLDLNETDIEDAIAWARGRTPGGKGPE